MAVKSLLATLYQWVSDLVIYDLWLRTPIHTLTQTTVA